MSQNNRSQRTLKNSTQSSRQPQKSVTTYSAVLLLQASLLAIHLIPSPQTFADAQETPKWRRTKDGWMDMTEDLRQSNPASSNYSYSGLSSVWPAAATLCMGLTAYWLLTFESKPEYRNKLRKITKNFLGRFNRPSPTCAKEYGLEGSQAELPIPIPIRDENRL
jgi:hypothetical protein